jgi:hypothetical protein
LKAQSLPLARGPLYTHAAGGLLSKKSWHETFGNAAAHASTLAGVLPVSGARSAFSQSIASRSTQVARSPYVETMAAPSPVAPGSDEQLERSLQRAFATSAQAWLAVGPVLFGAPFSSLKELLHARLANVPKNQQSRSHFMKRREPMVAKHVLHGNERSFLHPGSGC